MSEDDFLLHIAKANVRSFFQSRGKVILPRINVPELELSQILKRLDDAGLLHGTELTEQGAQRISELQLEDTPTLGLQIAMSREINCELKGEFQFFAEGLTFSQVLELGSLTTSQLWLALTYLVSTGSVSYQDGKIRAAVTSHIIQYKA